MFSGGQRMNTPGRLQVMCTLCADTFASGASGKTGQKARTFLNERQGNIQRESPL